MILDMARKSYEETLQKGIAEKFLLRIGWGEGGEAG
jgi:hypothetical protein